MKTKTSNIDVSIQVPITTTTALKHLALLISEHAGSCNRNSLATGTGKSISHGYNHSLLLAAKYYGLVDLTKINGWYSQYKSKA
jgi:hypothetical protein